MPSISCNLSSSKAIFYSKTRMPLLLLCHENDRLKPHNKWYLATRDSLKPYKLQFNPLSVSTYVFQGHLMGPVWCGQLIQIREEQSENEFPPHYSSSGNTNSRRAASVLGDICTYLILILLLGIKIFFGKTEFC